MYTKCSLYSLQSKNMLLRVLSINDKKWIKQSVVHQNIYPYIDNSGKARLIEAPSYELKTIQRQIKNKLIKCEFPNYVYSGIKGRSYVDNAKTHEGKGYLYKIDISAFFPNISREIVYKFFCEDLRTSPDVSEILTNFCTYDLSETIRNNSEISEFVKNKRIRHFNHLCTGSACSPLLSYLVNKKMFDAIHKLSKENDIRMTIYVDDIIFSSDKPISKNFRINVLKIIIKSGYNISKNKVKYYRLKDVKKVTGVIIRSDGSIDIPNKLRLKIVQELECAKEGDLKSVNRLRGCVYAARQIRKNQYSSIIEFINKDKLKKVSW